MIAEHVVASDERLRYVRGLEGAISLSKGTLDECQ
jgi:hypothetical protein